MTDLATSAMDFPEILTVREVAKYMSVRDSVVRHLLKTNQLRHTPIPIPGDKKDRVRILRHWVDDFMEAHGVGGPKVESPLSPDDAAIVDGILSELSTPTPGGVS